MNIPASAVKDRFARTLAKNPHMLTVSACRNDTLLSCAKQLHSVESDYFSKEWYPLANVNPLQTSDNTST